MVHCSILEGVFIFTHLLLIKFQFFSISLLIRILKKNYNQKYETLCFIEQTFVLNKLQTGMSIPKQPHLKI